jgi:hypothetical protein
MPRALTINYLPSFATMDNIRTGITSAIDVNPDLRQLGSTDSCHQNWLAHGPANATNVFDSDPSGRMTSLMYVADLGKVG